MKAKTRWRIEFLLGSLLGSMAAYYWLGPYLRAAAHYFAGGH